MEQLLTASGQNPNPWQMRDYPGRPKVNAINEFECKHVEAFAIMQYAPKDAGIKSVFIWNSRDGVTPFVVYIDGIEFHHVNWQQDRYSPNYRPMAGDLIFRDCTEDEAKLFAERRIEQFKETKFYPKTQEDRTKALDEMIADNLTHPVLAKVTSISFTSELYSSNKKDDSELD